MTDAAVMLLYFPDAKAENRDEIRDRKRELLNKGYDLKWNAEFDPSDIRRTDRGKPYDAAHPERWFNLTDTAGGWIAAVFADQEVGIDMERDRKISRRMIRHMAEEETAYLLQDFSEETRRMLFLRLWTMKEAYVKMTGEGLSGAALKRSFLPALRQVLRSREGFAEAEDAAGSFAFTQSVFQNGAVVTVASRGRSGLRSFLIGSESAKDEAGSDAV